MSPDPDLRDRVVLVTGASAGIGRATALALAARGATVVGAARSRDRLERLEGVEAVAADVTVAADRSRLVEHVVERHGRLDVLVNNAGVGAVGFLGNLSGEQVERVYATNVTAVADLTRLALPHLCARPRADVVMVSSAAAWAAVPPLSVYCSSKFAVDGLVEGLRRELYRSSVRVHSVNPGFVRTEWLSRAGDHSPAEGEQVAASPGYPPERVADAVLRALSSSSRRTLAVPRWVGLARLAQLPPVGAALDLALGLGGRRFTDAAQRMVAARSR